MGTTQIDQIPDLYVTLSDEELEARIAQAKAVLGSRLVILGHHYQRDEVVKFADFRGDSLKLSQLAVSRPDAEYIVFCGVYFMAETADILSDNHQTVFLPDLNAGCSLADMASLERVKVCWEDLTRSTPARIVPVTYINSTAPIKAFVGRNGGAICTSANANKVTAWALQQGDKVLFIPDEHLGRNTTYRLGIPLEEMVVWNPLEELGGLTTEQIRRARIILWKGHCSVHQRFLPEHVARLRKKHPGVRVVVHPECRWDVCQLADEVGSTEYIIQAVSSAAPGSRWAVGTEIHMVHRLAHEYPDRFVTMLEDSLSLCSTMFRISPQHLCWTLESLLAGRAVNLVQVDPETKHWARTALERMFAIK